MVLQQITEECLWDYLLAFLLIIVFENEHIWHSIISSTQIYQYDRKPQEPEDAEMYWKGRLAWKGSKDLQDISISIVNVSANDSGTYECEVSRLFEFDSFKHSATKKITIELNVKMQGKWANTADSTSSSHIQSDYFISAVWFGWLRHRPFPNML